MDGSAGDEVLQSLASLFEPRIDTICPFGDIVLVAKDDFLPPASFRVSSCILAMSSKVFTALFSKNFSEGQSISTRTPGEPLKINTVDRPQAMKHLLRLLHHTDPLDSGEEILTTSAILDLAIIIDKYDCIEALRLPAYALLAKYRGDEKCQLDHLLTAAYMLDEPEHFRYFTKVLVATKVMIQAKDFDKKCLELLPSCLLPSLFCQESVARQAITTSITMFIQRSTKACKVADRQVLVVELLGELEARCLLPVTSDSNIQSMCSGIEAISIPIISVDDHIETSVRDPWYERSDSVSRLESPSIGDGWGNTRPREHRKRSPQQWTSKSIKTYAPVHRDLKSVVESVQQLVVGICLDCIQDKECRKRHCYYWSDTWSRIDNYKTYEDSEGQSVFSRRDIDDDQYDVFMRNNERPGY